MVDQPEPSKWAVLSYPVALLVVPVFMLYAVVARDDLGQPLAAIIIGLAAFSLAGGLLLLVAWWRKFGRTPTGHA